MGACNHKIYSYEDYSNMFEVENTTHAVPRFRGAHVSQSGAPKGDPHRFQCYNNVTVTGVFF